MSRKNAADDIVTIGIDIGKNSFHLIGLDKRGAIVIRIKLSRRQLGRRLANIPRCLIGMEACAGAHHLRRTLEALGHDVRLIPAQYLKPFLTSSSGSLRSIGSPKTLSMRPSSDLPTGTCKRGHRCPLPAWPD